MKKLKLESLDFLNSEILTRSQLKKLSRRRFGFRALWNYRREVWVRLKKGRRYSSN